MNKLLKENLNKFYIDCVNNFNPDSVFLAERSICFPPLIQYRMININYQKDFEEYYFAVIWE